MWGGVWGTHGGGQYGGHTEMRSIAPPLGRGVSHIVARTEEDWWDGWVVGFWPWAEPEMKRENDSSPALFLPVGIRVAGDSAFVNMVAMRDDW